MSSPNDDDQEQQLVINFVHDQNLQDFLCDAAGGEDFVPISRRKFATKQLRKNAVMSEESPQWMDSMKPEPEAEKPALTASVQQAVADLNTKGVRYRIQYRYHPWVIDGTNVISDIPEGERPHMRVYVVPRPHNQIAREYRTVLSHFDPPSFSEFLFLLPASGCRLCLQNGHAR